jgi:hypothetical protein
MNLRRLVAFSVPRLALLIFISASLDAVATFFVLATSWVIGSVTAMDISER